MLGLDPALSHAADLDRRTPLELAVRAGHDAIADLLFAAGNNSFHGVFDNTLIFYFLNITSCCKISNMFPYSSNFPHEHPAYYDKEILIDKVRAKRIIDNNPDCTLNRMKLLRGSSIITLTVP